MGNKYKIISEAFNHSDNIDNTIIQIIEQYVEEPIDDLNASLVIHYGVEPKTIANILIDIEEKLNVFMSQEIDEKEKITAQSLIDIVKQNLNDPHARLKVVKQIASNIEIKENKYQIVSEALFYLI